MELDCKKDSDGGGCDGEVKGKTEVLETTLGVETTAVKATTKILPLDNGDDENKGDGLVAAATPENDTPITMLKDETELKVSDIITMIDTIATDTNVPEATPITTATTSSSSPSSTAAIPYNDKEGKVETFTILNDEDVH
eukprot:2100475-Ditylum_brightwellii.AAC.1